MTMELFKSTHFFVLSKREVELNEYISSTLLLIVVYFALFEIMFVQKWSK